MRLVHWNILHGGGARRAPGIALHLLTLEPDLVALTEFRTTSGGGLRGVLADHGLPHQSTTGPPAGKNGILLASRWPIEPGEPPPHEPMTLRWLDARLPAPGLRVTVVHIPDARRQDARALSRKALYWRALLASARAGLLSDAGERRILLGDFNSGRHHLDEPGATLTCTALLGELATAGYRDAWRLARGAERAASWMSHAGAGFRLDHAFVSPALAPAVRSACYAPSHGLSDHAPMTVDLEHHRSAPPRSVGAKNPGNTGSISGEERLRDR